jgi:hypothetical protein
MMQKFIILVFFTIQPDNSTTLHYTIEQELNNKKECVDMAKDIFYYQTPLFRKSNVLTLDTQCLIISKEVIINTLPYIK